MRSTLNGTTLKAVAYFNECLSRAYTTPSGSDESLGLQIPWAMPTAIIAEPFRLGNDASGYSSFGANAWMAA